MQTQREKEVLYGLCLMANARTTDDEIKVEVELQDVFIGNWINSASVRARASRAIDVIIEPYLVRYCWYLLAYDKHHIYVQESFTLSKRKTQKKPATKNKYTENKLCNIK